MDNKWINWLKENVDIGVAKSDIIDILKKNNFSDKIIEDGFKQIKQEYVLFDYNKLNPIEINLFCDILKNRNRINEAFNNNNIIKINNFFSDNVANFIYSEMMNVKEWTLNNKPLPNTKLDFSFCFNNKVLGNIFNIISQLFPQYPVFDMSMAKYSKNDGIAEHTDQQGYIYNDTKYCRHIAFIIYFNKDWTEKDGGLLHDIENNEYHLPSFNTAVLFKVPHRHAVTKVIDPNKNRYSIFGWFSEIYKNQYYLNDTRFTKTSTKY